MNKALACILVVMALYLVATKFIGVSVVDALPWVTKSFHSPFYNLCALAVLAITLWGIFRVWDHKVEDD